MCVDLASAEACGTIATAMSARPDVITMIAFIEHLPEPAELVSRYISLLPPGGRMIGTTPHPRGRWVHDALASVGICSKDGAKEHEKFLGRAALADVAKRAGAEMTHYQLFLMGLNQAFEFKRIFGSRRGASS
jgi:2-polyprenyl-3-methyl-5-hydroxy-6-metoxy-1,4-benzoquinol methylase